MHWLYRPAIRLVTVVGITLMLITTVLFIPSRSDAAPRNTEVVMSVVAERTDVLSPSTMRVVLSLTTRLSDTHATMDFSIDADPRIATIIGLGQDSIATTCQLQAQTASCHGAITATTPHLAVLDIAIASNVPPYTQITFQGTGVVSGTSVQAEDVVYISASAVTTATPTPMPATATPMPAGNADPQPNPTDGVPPSASPPASPSSTVRPNPDGNSAMLGDYLENNYDSDHASVIVPGTTYPDLDFVAPSTSGLGDVDYVTWFAKANRCYVLETANLAPELDTNIELLNRDQQILTGNDDVSAIDVRSAVRYCASSDMPVYARIAQNSNIPLLHPAGKTYTLKLSIHAQEQPTPTLAEPLKDTVPAGPTMNPKNDVLPSVPTKGNDGSPIDVPASVVLDPSTGSVTVGIGGSVPVLGDNHAQTCPESEQQAIPDTGMYAGPLPCDSERDDQSGTLGLGTAHVSIEHAWVYSGAGAENYALIRLPQDTVVRLTGQIRNGFVSVSLEGQKNVPPLIGWIYASFLSVDSWDQGTTRNPQVRSTASGATTQPQQPSVVTGGTSTRTYQLIPTVDQVVKVTINVCQQSTAMTCLPDYGIRGARVQIMNAAGDLFTTGVTNAEGRITAFVRKIDGLRVVIPTLNVSQDLSFTSDDLTVIDLPIKAMPIPATFR